jgi:AcrR family transcriptional regulator
MSLAMRGRLSPDETRQRIIDAAEEHFRRVGYAKTAVADIAEALGMSSANIYRFFPSKAAINEAICQRLMDQCHVLIESHLAAPGSASERLRAIALAMHRNNKAMLTHEKRIHDMVEAAMNENWGVIEVHIRKMEEYFARLVREGQAAGEFKPDLDPAHMGIALEDLFLCLFHPTLIAQCADKDQERQGHLLVDFALLALRR